MPDILGTLTKKKSKSGPVKLLTQFSEPMQFNTLHVPKLQRLYGNYNYYLETEQNAEYNENKDLEAPAQAPMFVRLMWETINKLQLAPTVPSTSTFHDVEIEGLSEIRIEEVTPANSEVMSRDSTIIITR